MIGDELGRLRNPVLRRRMFTTPAQKAAMARGAFGVNASGPELIKATSTQPDLLNRLGLVTPVAASTMNSSPRPVNPNPQTPNIPPVVSGTGQGEFEGVGPQEDKEFQPPANTSLDDVPPSFQQPKKKKDSGDDDPKPKSVKSTIDDVINSIANMTGTEEQASKKTRKQKFQEAKDFLAEAGVTQAKDVRTDRDFLMMLGGLKFAAGSGTGSMSQDAVAALSSVLGTFASGKQEERQLEQKLNMAAVESVMADERADKQAATARQLAMDKLSIQAALKQAELEQDPKMIREVEGIMAKTNKSFEEALALYNLSSAKTPGAEVQAAQALMARGIPEATARLLARDTDLVSKILTNEISLEDLNALLSNLATVQSSGNTGGNTGGDSSNDPLGLTGGRNSGRTG